MRAVGFAVWERPVSQEGAANESWFRYLEGTISVKNPDLPSLKKMYGISTELSAIVRGDEGEEYDELGGPLVVPKDDQIAGTKLWWRFWS